MSTAIDVANTSLTIGDQDHQYLMVYFRGSSSGTGESLRYSASNELTSDVVPTRFSDGCIGASSTNNGKCNDNEFRFKWRQRSSGSFADIRMRDPFTVRVVNTKGKSKFYMVHTHGWDHTQIGVWASDDLVNWQGGMLQVLPGSSNSNRLGRENTPDSYFETIGTMPPLISAMPNAWAPSLFYEEEEERFYVFWTSRHYTSGTQSSTTVGNAIKPRTSNATYYLTTTNWQTYEYWDSVKDVWITFDPASDEPQLYMNPSSPRPWEWIDISIIKIKDTYFGVLKKEGIGSDVNACLVHLSLASYLFTGTTLKPGETGFFGTPVLMRHNDPGREGPFLFKELNSNRVLLYEDQYTTPNCTTGSYSVDNGPLTRGWYATSTDIGSFPDLGYGISKGWYNTYVAGWNSLSLNQKRGHSHTYVQATRNNNKRAWKKERAGFPSASHGSMLAITQSELDTLEDADWTTNADNAGNGGVMPLVPDISMVLISGTIARAVCVVQTFVFLLKTERN